MKYLAMVFFFVPLLLFSQEARTDSSLVSENANKIDELKKMIRSSVEKEDELKSLKGELSAANARILVLEQTLDSLLQSLKPSVKSEPSGTYYIVVEAQKSRSRGLVALNLLQKQLDDELRLVLSESGNWFFIVLSEIPSDNDLISRLDQARSEVPDAWFVERTKTQQVLDN